MTCHVDLVDSVLVLTTMLRLPWFEYSQCEFLFSSNCIEKTKIKKKEVGMVQFLQKQRAILLVTLWVGHPVYNHLLTRKNMSQESLHNLMA